MVDSAKASETVELQSVSKAFDHVPALKSTSLSIARGEVHGLAGANGAGKSTLVKVLTGVERPDSGTLHLWGNRYVAPREWLTPVLSNQLGIGVVYQEFSLLSNLSVAENIFLGRLPVGKGGAVRWTQMTKASRSVLAALGLDIDPLVEVKKLPVAQQQLVEIAKAVSQPAQRLLIMDEPSAVLGGQSLELLYSAIREVRSQGIAILYISHRLDEVLALSDRVTVLRDGETIMTGEAKELSESDLVEAMTGQSVKAHATSQSNRLEHLLAPLIIEVRDLSTRDGAFKEISLTVSQGEILGLAGLVGSGRSRLLRAIFGDIPLTKGEIRVEGKPRSPGIRGAIAAGIGYVPEDRKLLGLIHTKNLGFNISLASLAHITRKGFVSKRSELAIAKEYISRLGIKCRGPADQVAKLSGGNQQKSLLARWLAVSPKVLLLDEPTRGIDVSSRADIYDMVRNLASQGVALVIASADSKELCDVCDRILVMRDRQIVGEFVGSQIVREDIDALAARTGSGVDVHH